MASTGYRGPRNPNVQDGESSIIIYGYVPSAVLGGIAVVTFALAALVHLYWIFKSKGYRWFGGLMVGGCIAEGLGYIFRILSHSHPYKLSSFIAQYFLIVCAPVAFAAALYLTLNYAIKINPSNMTALPIRPKVFVTTFITLDILTTILQIAGAALVGLSASKTFQGQKSPLTPTQANHILLAGLALQVASFTVFLGLLTSVILKQRSSRGTVTAGSAVTDEKVELGNTQPTTFSKSFLGLLVITSLLIYTRTIFRMAETAEGLFSTAATAEALFGVFEFAPVLLAVAIWAVRPLHKEIEKMQVLH